MKPKFGDSNKIDKYQQNDPILLEYDNYHETPIIVLPNNVLSLELGEKIVESINNIGLQKTIDLFNK